MMQVYGIRGLLHGEYVSEHLRTFQKGYQMNPSLWWMLAAVFAGLGFWGSMAGFLLWPVAFVVGVLMVPALRRRFDRWQHLTAIATGLVLGGIPMWLILGINLTSWWKGLIGDAITGLLFLAGSCCFYLYAALRSIVVKSNQGDPPAPGLRNRLLRHFKGGGNSKPPHLSRIISVG